jgi:uncharacterized repeat protein (TIGR03803 family)
VLVVGLGLMLVGPVSAQTFTVLHSFTPTSPSLPGRNSDGAYPDEGGLVLSNNTLYGSTVLGGLYGRGTIFKVNVDGSGFAALHSFSPIIDLNNPNYDGAEPLAGLILSGSTLYGVATYGGSGGNGTVFGVNTDGSGFRTLYSFTQFPFPFQTNDDGANPIAGVVLSGNTLYGTTYDGGTIGNGTLFAVNIDGTQFRTFSDGGFASDGVLTSSSNTLYGTTIFGGSSGNGTVFKVNTNGTGFTVLHTFTGIDGADSFAGMILSGNTLYGTTSSGGTSGEGTVFRVNTDGSGFVTLRSFTNSDGASPHAGLILLGNTLYGTAQFGGSLNSGTVFTIGTDGTGFSLLHTFTGGSDGATPVAPLILSGNTFYGTTSGGGSFGYGTVFSLSFTPQLTLIPSGPNLTLSWPTNYAGFDYTGFTLQSTTNLASPVWTTNLTAPVLVNGQYTVTNPISGTQQFFRLGQ